MRADPSGPLWVITSYFNPARSRRRRENYDIFRRNLNAPLLTMELATAGHHQLGSADADELVHLNGDDFIWQKERLLNLAVRELPPHVRHVAWMDCDIVCDDANWTSAALAELDRDGGLLHLFSRAVHLPKDLPQPSSARAFANLPPLISEPSIGHAASIGAGAEALRACYDKDSRRAHGNTCATGMALAAPRDVLEAAGLYDGAIIGGGDAILMCASLGLLEYRLLQRQVNPHEFRHITRWADEARRAGLFNRFRALTQTVYHLWHGELGNRRYGRRHEVTSALDFDPSRDLRRAANGTWKWTDPESELARSVREYFLSRREDV